MIAIGSIDASKVYLGSAEVGKIYLGSTQVWGGTPPTPPTPAYDAEVEWLKSDSNGQYIDTGIECTGDLKVRFIGMVHDNTSATHAAGGISIVNGSVTFRHHWTPFYNNRDKGFYNISSGGVTGATFVSQNLVNGWVDVVVEPAIGNMGINGYLTQFTSVSSSLTTGKNYGIFARIDNSGNVVAEPSSFKLFQMWKNGVLVRDFIPVRVGQVGYFYDKVSGQLFGNAGSSGSFILGNDVSSAFDSEIEYIASTDSSNFQIDTRVIRPESFTSIEFEIKAQFTDTSGTRTQGSDGSFYIGVQSSQWQVGYNRYYGTADTSVHVFKRTLTKDSGNALHKVWIDDAVAADYSVEYSDSQFASSFGLFTKNLNIFNGGCICKIYYAKLKIDGELVFDGIPVRVGQVGYIYDRISYRLFGNVGSGTFTLGNDVTN